LVYNWGEEMREYAPELSCCFITGNQEERRETEIVWQMTQSLELDDYRMESDVKYSLMENGETQNMRLGCELECDGRKNSFDGKISMKDVSDNFELVLQAAGGLSHVTKGESFDLELDEMTLSANDEEVCLVRGDIGLSPLKRRVKQNVRAKTPFFEMSDREWETIFERVYRSYENLMQSIYGMWW